jgi:hypothetical protein
MEGIGFVENRAKLIRKQKQQQTVTAALILLQPSEDVNAQDVSLLTKLVNYGCYEFCIQRNINDL